MIEWYSIAIGCIAPFSPYLGDEMILWFKLKYEKIEDISTHYYRIFLMYKQLALWGDFRLIVFLTACYTLPENGINKTAGYLYSKNPEYFVNQPFRVDKYTTLLNNMLRLETHLIPKLQVSHSHGIVEFMRRTGSILNSVARVLSTALNAEQRHTFHEALNKI